MALIVLLSFWSACGGSEARSSSQPLNPSVRDPWQYPIRLGDTQAKVHQLLGDPSEDLGVKQDHPTSGVRVSFDRWSRVSKLLFVADQYYTFPDLSHGIEWIQSDHEIVFGLTMRANEDVFKRELGVPIRQWKYETPTFPEIRCVWRKGGYIIEGHFLGSDHNFLLGSPEGKAEIEEKPVRKGSLRVLEISPGL